MVYFSKKFFISENFNKYKLAELLFSIGIFFLCSSITLSGLFLLPSLIFGTLIQLRKKSFFKNPWHCSFFICGILIILNALMQRFIIPNRFEEIWDPNLTIIGIGNWIPLFWIFWACQPFLDSQEKRKNFSLILIASTFPLLITGFGQYYFGWNGPFETLNGLIIWYLRPSEGNLAGLFSNQNYTGSWFNLVLPFCIALVFEKSRNLFKKSTSFFFLSATSFAIILTNSRNAWAGLALALPLFMGKEGIILVLFGCFLFLLVFSPIFSGILQSNIQNLVPTHILHHFAPAGYQDMPSTRIDLFLHGIEIIKINPLIGTGAASFSSIYQQQTNFYRGHSHNLFSELAISYGVPVTIIFAISIISLLIISYYFIFLINKKTNELSFIDRSYWVAVFFFFLSQLADIQYFEGRISILVWILIASLKNIIDENIYKKKSPKLNKN